MKKSSELNDEETVAFGKIAECALGLLLLILPLIFFVQLAYVLLLVDMDTEWLCRGLKYMNLVDNGESLIFLGMLVIAAVLLLKDSLGTFIAFVIYAIADDDK